MSASASPDIRVELPGMFVLRHQRLERLIKLLHPLMVLNEPAVIDVDLSRMVSIGPSALALLVATLRRIEDRGLLGDGSMLEPPRSPGLKTTSCE
jgi:ABC-type transporter Mla MlaB component